LSLLLFDVDCTSIKTGASIFLKIIKQNTLQLFDCMLLLGITKEKEKKNMKINIKAQMTLELQEILEKHKLWINNEGSQRAPHRVAD